MTYATAQVVDALSQLTLTSNPPIGAKEKLLHGVGLAALEFIALAVGSSSERPNIMPVCLDLDQGTNAMAVRKRVYLTAMRKEMTWFDTKIGAEDTILAGRGDE